MRGSSDSLLPFTIGSNTPVQQILVVHDAYLRAKDRRQFVEHAVAIVGGMVIFLALPLYSPTGLRRILLFAWLALVVVCAVLGASEVLLLRRRERLMAKLNH